MAAPAHDGGAAPFARIGIVGLGLIGGSIALAAKRAWPSALVVGVDEHPVLEDAQRAHAIDVGADHLDMVAEVDLVVLAAPVLANVELLAALPDVIAGETVVTDVGSTKGAMADAARGLPPRLAFVGGHPLAGAARAGIAFASPELFRERPWILTPGETASPDAVDRLTRFVRALGGVPRLMTPAEHDRVTAWISHLPQLTASTLMRVIGDAVHEDGLALAGRGLRDTTRLASSPAHVWTDVCRTNAAAIGAALDRLVAELTRLRKGLDDPAVVEQVFEAAASWREQLQEPRQPL